MEETKQNPLTYYPVALSTITGRPMMKGRKEKTSKKDTDKLIDSFCKDLATELKSNEDVMIEINRGEPITSHDNGYPEVVPCWIEQTITIKSKYYHNPVDLMEKVLSTKPHNHE